MTAPNTTREGAELRRSIHWQRAYREIREDRSTSYALRAALAESMDRDPLDALADAETLATVLAARLEEIQGGSGVVNLAGRLALSSLTAKRDPLDAIRCGR